VCGKDIGNLLRTGHVGIAEAKLFEVGVTTYEVGGGIFKDGQEVEDLLAAGSLRLEHVAALIDDYSELSGYLDGVSGSGAVGVMKNSDISHR
jgi:hypothetical protein